MLSYTGGRDHELQVATADRSWQGYDARWHPVIGVSMAFITMIQRDEDEVGTDDDNL